MFTLFQLLIYIRVINILIDIKIFLNFISKDWSLYDISSSRTRSKIVFEKLLTPTRDSIMGVCFSPWIFFGKKVALGRGRLSQDKHTYLTRIRTRSKLVLIPPLDFDPHLQYLRVNIARTRSVAASPLHLSTLRRCDVVPRSTERNVFRILVFNTLTVASLVFVWRLFDCLWRIFVFRKIFHWM